MRVKIRGAVQGVGFRPFVHRLAGEEGLRGWVNNTGRGVTIEVEGPAAALDRFLIRIPRDKPPVSRIHGVQHAILDPVGYTDFRIRDSESPAEADAGHGTSAVVLPDIAVCDDCLRELFDPSDRRYRYPFINCTNCGPRYSIIRGLPYDRRYTTMSEFEMCPSCAAEYRDPENRRFHAQPNACPACGPRIEWRDTAGNRMAGYDDALFAAAVTIRSGGIAAVKGLGGFHLMADARSEEAVGRLRERKHRDEKPFAVMMPGIDSTLAHCAVSDLETFLLKSPEAPIVLVRRGETCPVTPGVAPGNPYVGVMLPYTPLHHLLMQELGFPVVATSGNVSDEPICFDERDALERLAGIADGFLVHDRPIERPVDDSVVRVVAGRPLVLRRARGYAPLPVLFDGRGDVSGDRAMLAVGGFMKNTVAIARDHQIIVSQHLGDLSTQAAYDRFNRTIDELSGLYRVDPAAVVCDAHPGYPTTAYAEKFAAESVGDMSVTKVQHHHAHAAACMAENELEGPVLAVVWDGTGYGDDGTVWGGEFLRVADGTYERVAHLRLFRLPGGDEAAREPRRSAAGLLYECGLFDGSKPPDVATTHAFSDADRRVVAQMLERGIHAPKTSSAGRLFDAVASILGERQINNFEGQAAMELEFALGDAPVDDAYRCAIIDGSGRPGQIDWAPMILGIFADLKAKVPLSVVSAKFHNALAMTIGEIATRVGEERVALTGGCFQNRYLAEKTIQVLETKGFKPYWHQYVPTNDGGLALGQLAVALAANHRGD